MGPRVIGLIGTPRFDTRTLSRMAGTSSWRVRSQPCTGCGGKVVVVEDSFSGLGGLLRFPGLQRIQHADFEPAVNRVDQVDDDCSRVERPRA